MDAKPQTAVAPQAPMIGRWPRGRVLTIAAFVAYVVATVAFIVIRGQMIQSRDAVFAWALIGLLVLSLNDVRGWARGFVFDWLPFFAILWVYDFTRSLAKHSPFPVHSALQIRFDELIHKPVPTVLLQRHLYHPPHAAVYDYASWGVYITHFFATVVVAAYLWKWAYPRFRRWRTVVLWLSAAGMLTYILYPADPPWLSALHGQIPHIEQIIPEMFRHMNIGAVHSLAEADFANPVAAVPSLHSAFPMLMLLFFWSSGWRTRIFFGIYTLAMAFVLVYSGEHYVFDIALGWTYAIGTWFAVSTFWRWQERRAADRVAAASPAAPLGRAAEPEPEPAGVQLASPAADAAAPAER